MITIGAGVLLDVLFEAVGSLCNPEIETACKYDPVLFTFAMRTKEALAPLARVPTVQVEPAQVPFVGVALTNVYPFGMLSVTATPVASLGPLF